MGELSSAAMNLSVCVFCAILALSLVPGAVGGAVGDAGALDLFPPSIKWKDTQLDWFRFYADPGSPTHFRQRILYYDKFWTLPSGPMLVFWGGEGGCEDFYNNSGSLFEMAPRLNALIVFLEHRYFGQSLPFGDRSYGTAEMRYLTIEQALADMTDLLAQKEQLFGCTAGGCEAVLLGGSYGGMASAWHRLKYPHLTKGAIAASAPVDIYPGEGKATTFWQAALYTFTKYGSAQCGNWIEQAVSRINATADKALLSSSFRTCEPISTAIDVERLAFYIKGALATEAMVDYPYASSFVTPMPANPVKYACDAVGEYEPTDQWLFNSLNQVQNVFLNWTSQLRCHNSSAELLASASPLLQSVGGSTLGDISLPWNYMACSSLILEPLTSDGDGFFVESDSQIPEVEAACSKLFGRVQSRIKWMPTAYGNGIQLAQNLRNTFFSDGDKDPWRVGGMPANSSEISPDGSVVRVLIEGAAHHQDLRFADPADSADLVRVRQLEFKHIQKWLS